MVIGLLTAGNAAGQLVFLPTMAALVDLGRLAGDVADPGALRPRSSCRVVALADARPAGGSIGLRAYGDTGAPPAAVAARAGNPMAVAFRALGDGVGSRDFWLIAGSYFICGASTNGLIGTHLIPACVDHGLTEVTGAGLLAATGVFAFIGGTASGWLSDRFDNRASCCSGITGCAACR